MATILQVRPPAERSPDSQALDAATLVVGDNLIGRTIGSYAVMSELGRGGMGCVYLAEHTLIGRKAAIKVLNPDIASDPEVISRFFTEARAVNDIRHPNIVEVTDFGQFGPLYCIVMEFLEGETLASRLTRVRAFDERTVVGIMKQCTSALSAAHEQGLVHRDLKPENIFLRAHPDYPDFVKLLDFGIAKLLGNDSAVGHHTKTGSVLGTPSYMSPEQCLGESALDIRSDVYSLGIVIYQMLTGQLPFSGDTLGRLIVCHVNEAPVPPIVLAPSLSRAMNDLVLKTLQKKPKDRFQSARDMRDALERVLAPHARVPTPIFGVKAHPPFPEAAPAAPGSRAGTGAAGGVAAFPSLGRGGSAPPSTRARPTPVTSIDARPAIAAAVAAASPRGDVEHRLITIARDRIAEGLVELPDLPGATIRCIELGARGRLGFTDAATIINEVPALRSRLMRLANSAAFPSLMPATTIELAVARFGSQGLLTALLEMAAREALEGKQPRVKEAMRRIWPHALGTAVMTSEMCPSLGLAALSPIGYQAGLLVAVGRPVVGALLLDVEQQMQRAGNRAAIPQDAFIATIEACAPAAGAAVARHWELPAPVAQAIEDAATWNGHEPLALSNVVRFAGALAFRLGLTFGVYSGAEIERTFGEGRALLRIDDAALKRLGHSFKERIIALSAIRG